MFDENEIKRLAEEVERAHQFLDECHIGGDGTEPLVERISRAVAAHGWAGAPGYIVCRNRMPLSYHERLDWALAEAERLCRKERETFILFVAAGEVRLAEAPVVWKWDAVVRETAS